MAAEVEVIEHMNDVVQAVLVAPPQVVQDADFHQGLVVKPFLVPAIRGEPRNREDETSCIVISITNAQQVQLTDVPLQGKQVSNVCL